MDTVHRRVRNASGVRAVTVGLPLIPSACADQRCHLPRHFMGSVCFGPFVLAVLRAGRGGKTKEQLEEEITKILCVTFCLLFLSRLITGQHAEEAEDV